MADWHVGQMVVCVDGDFSFKRRGEITPVRGCVYTIRGFTADGTTIWLAEIINDPRHYSDGFLECSWKIRRFRPVRKTSIDIFRSLLTPAGQEGPASPVSPVRVPALDHVSHEGTCQFPNCDEALCLPAGGPSLRPTAARLALKLDGAPLLHSSVSSGLNLSADPKISTRGFRNAGKSVQKTGK